MGLHSTIQTMVEHIPFFLSFLDTLILWFGFKTASCFIAEKTRSLSHSTTTRFYNESQVIGFLDMILCSHNANPLLLHNEPRLSKKVLFVLFHWTSSYCMTCWELLLLCLRKSKCLLMWHAIEQSTLLTSRTIFNRGHKGFSSKENNTVAVNQPTLALALSQRDGNIV